MIRLHDPVVERVAVRQEDVEVAVLVEIDELDARRAPVRMRRRVDHLLLEREVAGARVDVGDDGLVLLREQRDEVHLAVAVQIDRDDVDAARRADRSCASSNAGCDGFVVRFSRIGDLPGLAPAERGDREIVLAVAVEVGGLDVGDARPAVEPEGAELAVARPRSQIDRALVVIGRKELAEIADEQILHAVLVDVGERDVRRVRNAGDRPTARRRRPPGWPVNTSPWRMSVPSTSSCPSPSRSTSAHVRHRRRAGHVRASSARGA